MISSKVIRLKYLIFALLTSVVNVSASEPEISLNTPTQINVTAYTGQRVDFSFKATDIDGNLSGSEWYGNGDNPYIQHLSNTSGNGSSTTFTRTHTFVEQGNYSIVAMAFDRLSEYSEHITWNIKVIKDTAPKVSANTTQTNLTIYAGEMVDFSFNATDVNGRISGSEWYGNGDNPFLLRVGETSGTQSDTDFVRTHTFTESGEYKITGMAYNADSEYSDHIIWNVTVIADHSSTPPSIVGGRALYVNDFEVVLASKENTTRLLAFIQAHNITKLTLYDLRTELVSNRAAVSHFIDDARGVGVTSIGAAGGSTATFDLIMRYQNNNNFSKFDSLYLEYEYWNNGSDLETFVSLLDYMKDVGGTMEIETYLGWLDDEDYAPIANRVDNLFLHCYVTDAESAFSYCEERLEKFADVNIGLNIWPILSSEWRPTTSCDDATSTADALCFMGKWFELNGIAAAEQAFMKAYNTDSSSWKEQISIEGMHYFAYTFLDAEIGSTDFPINAFAPTFALAVDTDFSISNGETITFNATVIDVQGDLSGLDWVLYDVGSTSQSSLDVGGNGDRADFTTTHTFEHAGTYILSATAYDSQGNESRPIYSTVKVY